MIDITDFGPQSPDFISRTMRCNKCGYIYDEASYVGYGCPHCDSENVEEVDE